MRLITNDEMEVITSYMNDEIREDVHLRCEVSENDFTN